MPSHPRNMPEQERSIKARSRELFVDPLEASEGTKTTKPFPVYLRETPASPMSIFTKSVFWLVGIIVGVLFLAAVWRIGHHPTRRGPNRRAVAKTVMVDSLDGLERQTSARPAGAAR